MAQEQQSRDVTHYVIVSESRGIYLGNGQWSEINHGGGKNAALCLPKGPAVRVLKKVCTETGTAFLKEVHPDGPMCASEEACASAGLKRWDPQKYSLEDEK